jgi:hypothetical protein
MTESSSSSSPASNGTGIARSTLIVTNLIKLGGLIWGSVELATTKDPLILGMCILMMSGLHSFEQALVRMAERFFGNA